MMPRMTIVLPHPLFSRDSGNIRTLELLLLKPADFQVTILEMQFDSEIKNDNVDLFNSLSNVSLVSVKCLDHWIQSFNARPPISTFLLWFVRPLIISFMRFRYWRKLHFLKKDDIIYIFDNVHSRLIPRTRAFILGSNHGFIYERIARTGIRETLAKLAGKLTLLHLLNHRINGFHLFPGMLELIRVKLSDSIILPLGIMTSAYDIGIRTGKAKFLFAAQLKEGKGIITLIEAWKISGLGESANLEICGWGPMGEYLNSLNIKGVRFHGYVSDKDLRHIYSACDVFVYPTRGDNYGFTILEALASGMKVLTSEILRGLFDEYESAGYLYYTGEKPEDYAKRMVELTQEIDNIRSNAKSIREMTVRLNDIKPISKVFFDFCRTISSSEEKN